MKIAFLDSWIASSSEGSGTFVAITGLESALKDLGHEVDRISPKTKKKSLLLNRLQFNFDLTQMPLDKKYDTVVGFDIDGFLIPRCALGDKYFASVKGVLADESRQEKGWPHWYLKGLSYLEKRNTRKAPHVLTTSEHCRRQIEKYYGVKKAKIDLVPEGIDLKKWESFCARVPKTSDGNTILCVARQYPRKRVRDLITAMPLVRERCPEAKAVIIGDGPEHGFLKEQIHELGIAHYVSLLGAIPSDEEVMHWYRKADVFCLPTVQEGFGIVFLEAMAAGLPIVSTHSAAIPEVVIPQKSGILVGARKVNELSESLIELLKSPTLREEMGHYNQAHVQKYDWKNVAQSFLNAITKH